MQSSLVVIWFAMLAVAVECRNGSSSSNSDAAGNSPLQSTSNGGKRSIRNKSNNNNGNNSNGDNSNESSSDIGQDSSSDIVSEWKKNLEDSWALIDEEHQKMMGGLKEEIADLAVKKQFYYFALRSANSQRLDYYKLRLSGALVLLNVVVVALDNDHNGKRYLVDVTDIYSMYVVDDCINDFVCYLKAINNNVGPGMRSLFDQLGHIGFQGNKVLELRVSNNWNKLHNNDLKRKPGFYLYLLSNFGWFQRTNVVTEYWTSLANSFKIGPFDDRTNEPFKTSSVTAKIANGSNEVQFKYKGNVIPLMLVNIPEKYTWRHELRLYNKKKCVMYDLQVKQEHKSGYKLNILGVTKLSSEAKEKTSERLYLEMFSYHVHGRGKGNYIVLDFLQPFEETLDNVYLAPNGSSVGFHSSVFVWDVPSCPLSIPMLQQLSQQPLAKCKDYFYDGQIKKVNAAIL